MFFKIIYAASWLVLAVAQGGTITEHVFLVRNLDGSQGLCTLDATVTLSKGLGLELNFESNACSEMQTFHFFLANDTNSLTEVQLHSNSSATLIQYEAPYKIISSSHQIDLKQTVTKDSTFKGRFTLDSGLSPINPAKYNLAVLMTRNTDPSCSDYLSYYYLVNAPISLPDLMVMDKYKVFGLNQ